VQAVILDLDGTLVDSSGEIHTAINRAFAEERLAAMTRAEVEALVGRGVRSLVERALPKAGGAGKDVDHMVERFEHHYAQVVGTDATLCPDARPGLEKLFAAGMPMSVVTNKPRSFTQRLLEELDVLRYFKSFVAGDDGFPRKPAGDMVEAACRMLGSEPARSIMIGDSDADIQAARAAGVPVWCVPYGYNEGRPPEALKGDRMVATIDEAARLILQI